MFLNNIISNNNKTKAKACIYNNYYLNQHCLKQKQILKINLNSWHGQLKKIQLKTFTTKVILYKLPNSSF